MNALRLIAAAVLLFAGRGLAAPHDRVDLKELKLKVSLTLGSKGTIEFKQQGDGLTAATLIKSPHDKNPGISVEFTKQPEFFALTLQNQLPKALRYRAAVRLKGRKDFFETSLIVPVMAGLISSEIWADPIAELVLFDFNLTDEKP